MESERLRFGGNIEFFLYDIENYLLIGDEITLDRSNNAESKHYEIVKDQKFGINAIKQIKEEHVSGSMITSLQ